MAIACLGGFFYDISSAGRIEGANAYYRPFLDVLYRVEYSLVWPKLQGLAFIQYCSAWY